MTTFTELVNQSLERIQELFPWDVEDKLSNNDDLLIVDVREKDEFDAMHVEGSLHVPRGILESSCEFGYEETVPELANARDREVLVICRSGRRSALAADVMQQMGYKKIYSLKTGLRGWNEYELPLIDKEGNAVDVDDADEFFTTHLNPEQEIQK